ncbi:hypothetical protein AX14_008006 [Amanita brunnescens Koide BX004]|nr:hypothetical protein AX14_008006 [Amanita brunnescens Koide BX004]
MYRKSGNSCQDAIIYLETHLLKRLQGILKDAWHPEYNCKALCISAPWARGRSGVFTKWVESTPFGGNLVTSCTFLHLFLD